ncbi:MAG: hypothetical protein ACRBN8_34245 [Nannocystales bacterium]
MLIIYNVFALFELLLPVGAALITPDAARLPVILGTYAIACSISELFRRGGRVFFLPTSIAAYGLLTLFATHGFGPVSLLLSLAAGLGAFFGLRALRERRGRVEGGEVE